MIVPEKEAKHLQCCADPSRQCAGEHCMGWIKEVAYPNKSDGFMSRGTIKPPTLGAPVETGRGYCGLVR